MDSLLLFPAERRIGEDDVDTILVAYLAEREAQAVARVDLWVLEPVKEEVHLAEEIRERLWLAAVDAPVLKRFPIFDRLALLLEVAEGLDEEAAGAARRVEHRLA